MPTTTASLAGPLPCCISKGSAHTTIVSILAVYTYMYARGPSYRYTYISGGNARDMMRGTVVDGSFALDGDQFDTL